jgi:hypothetical protein
MVKGDHEKRVSRLVDFIFQCMANEPEKKRLNRESIQTLVASVWKICVSSRKLDPERSRMFENVTTSIRQKFRSCFDVATGMVWINWMQKAGKFAGSLVRFRTP